MDPTDPALRLADKYALSSKNVVSSAYWKVPDPKTHLTAVACHQEDPLIAVASGAKDSNLFIYEINSPQDKHFFMPSKDPDDQTDDDDDELSYYLSASSTPSPAFHKKPVHPRMHKRSVSENSALPPTPPRSVSPDQQASPILTHHQTISLGGIYSLAWLPPKTHHYGNVLATGHNAGLLHLVLLPDPYTASPASPAEILHRFNHPKHLTAISPENPLPSVSSSRIRSINITSPAWSCCPTSSVVSLFSEHLFLWDSAHPQTPVIIQRTRHARGMHISPLRNGIVSLATDRGISIMDVRFKNPTALAPPTTHAMASLVKWCPLDENRLVSVHDHNTIKVWDIRAGAPLLSLDGHYDRISSIEWSTTTPDEFASSAADGTVRIWDIQKCASGEKGAPETPAANKQARPSHRRTRSGVETASSAAWLPSQSWRLYRQRLARENSLPSYNYFLDNLNPFSPCTTIFSNSRDFLGLATVQMQVPGKNRKTTGNLVTIDASGFLGVHSKLSQTDGQTQDLARCESAALQAHHETMPDLCALSDSTSEPSEPGSPRFSAPSSPSSPASSLHSIGRTPSPAENTVRPLVLLSKKGGALMEVDVDMRTRRVSMPV